MPVYPVYAPGLGEAIGQAFQNYVSARRQKIGLGIEQQQAADAHTAAEDAHTNAQIGAAVNYGFLPDGSPLKSATQPVPGGETPPPAQSADPALVSRFIGQTFRPGSAAQLPVTQTPSLGTGTAHGEAALPDLSAMPSSTDPSLGFQGTLTRAFSRAAAGRKNLPGQNAPVAQPSQTSQPAQASAPDAQSTFDGFMFPSSRVALPSGGSIDPYYGLRRELMLEQAKSGITTNAAINQSNATGATARNTAQALEATREANTPRLGDADYAQQTAAVEGAKAMATLPAETQKMLTQSQLALRNATTVEQIRASVQGMLQKNDQDFKAGQLTAQQKFAADQQVQRLAGDYVNQSALANQRARGTITGKLVAPPPSTVAPSTALITSSDPRAKAIDAMLKSGMTADEIRAALSGQPPAGTP